MTAPAGDRVLPASRHAYPIAALAAAATCLTIIYVHATSSRTLISAHGMLHVAAVQQFADGNTFAIPPENPFFAGERLPYYWVFHLVSAVFGSLAGIHPLLAMKGLILLATCGAWLSATALGRRLYGGIAPGMMMGLLAFAGANAFGALILLARLARGADVPADSGVYLWGIAHPVLELARYGDPNSLHGPLLSFFLNMTSRPVALALLFAVALALLSWVHHGRRSAWLCLVAAGAACAAMSPIIGVSAIPALAAGVLCTGFVVTYWNAQSSRPGEWRRTWLAAVGLLVGVVVASPTFYHLFLRGADAGIKVAPTLLAAKSVAGGASLLVILTVIALFRTSGTTRALLGAISFAAAILLLAAVMVKLPASNETNFFHSGAFLLAVPAAGAFGARSGVAAARLRYGAVAIVAATTLSTAGVLIYAYTHRPPVPLRITRRSVHRIPAEAPLAALYAWVEENTPSNAVFVMEPGPPIVTAVGNVPEFPALTQRAIFTANRTSYLVTPYTDADRRHSIAKTLVAGQALAARDKDYLSRLDRPLYLVSTRVADATLLQALLVAHGAPLFRRDSVAVFSIQ